MITTLKTKHAASDRFEAVGADTVDHYGDLKESNRLDDQRLDVLLGCQRRARAYMRRLCRP